MGVPQVYASVVAERGDNSAFLRFPYSGFSRTYSRNKYRTDSAATSSSAKSCPSCKLVDKAQFDFFERGFI